MSTTPPPGDGATSLTPEEAFALLGNDTRVGILQALWDAFESGTGDNALPYSEVFEQVDYDDSGNFTYHLEKLTGPFVRQTEEGYELKQTGINVVRAVVAGTVTEDAAFGPRPVDVDCPICGAGVEIAYDDELVAAFCTDCEGSMQWRGDPGLLYAGIVPPAGVESRPADDVFHAAVTHISHQVAALWDDICPHCASGVDARLEVCADHDPGSETLCPNCDRRFATATWMVCSTCKRSVFPPLSVVVLSHPAVTKFYRERGIDHHFASWEAVTRTFTATEAVRSEEPLRVTVTFTAGDDALQLTVDDEANVVDVSS